MRDLESPFSIFSPMKRECRMGWESKVSANPRYLFLRRISWVYTIFFGREDTFFFFPIETGLKTTLHPIHHR